jgi:hypothetical protein
MCTNPHIEISIIFKGEVPARAFPMEGGIWAGWVFRKANELLDSSEQTINAWFVRSAARAAQRCVQNAVVAVCLRFIYPSNRSNSSFTTW